MADDPHALPFGASIAGYNIVRVLGAGGFGITYEADSPFTGKRVAIKEFFPRGIASRGEGTRLVYAAKDAEVVEWALKRFESSTLEQCRLKHPNIVDVIHYVKDNGTGYMIMEYVEGETLEQWLLAGGAPSSEELRPLLSPVLDALDYLHQAGMIHRDIAPDNIMVRSDGSPIIIDFGAIKLIEQQTQLRSKSERSFMVMKQFYSPPEQIDEEGELDSRADIYSMGAVLYRVLAGQPPASAEARMKRRALNGEDTFVSIVDYAPRLSQKLADAIDRALSFDARDRQDSIAQLQGELGWSDEGKTTAALPRALRRDPSHTQRRSSLPWLLPLAGIAALAVAGLYAGGLISLPESRTVSPQTQSEIPAPKLDEVTEIPQMQVTAPDGKTAGEETQAEADADYPPRYMGEIVVYRVAERSPDARLTNCVPGRKTALSIEYDGASLHIAYGGNTYVTEVFDDGSFSFQSGGESGGLFARKMSFTGKITPEAIEGEYVGTTDQGSCYGKLTARPAPG